MEWFTIYSNSYWWLFLYWICKSKKNFFNFIFFSLTFLLHFFHLLFSLHFFHFIFILFHYFKILSPKYEIQAKKSISTRKYDLDEEHKKTIEQLNINDYKLSRIPRPSDYENKKIKKKEEEKKN